MNKEQVTQHKGKLEMAARAGFFAKGIVYIIVAVLAIDAAFGGGGEQVEGSKGAILELATQPFGQVLLWLMTIGLAGYALWKIYQGLVDPDMHGHDAKGIAHRLGYIGTGVVHVGLAVFAGSIAIGSGGSGQGQGTEGWTATLMEQPFGRWLVGIIGAGILLGALNEFYGAYTAKFRKKCNFQELGAEERDAAVASGRVGHAARGVIFALVGWFFLQAAITFDPSQAGGMQQALRSLQTAPYGPWLLGLVALGLALYGVFALLMTRYRRINV